MPRSPGEDVLLARVGFLMVFLRAVKNQIGVDNISHTLIITGAETLNILPSAVNIIIVIVIDTFKKS